MAARRNLNQTLLAETIGIGQSTVSRIIYRDDAPLNINLFEQICEALGEEPQDVFNRACISMRLQSLNQSGDRTIPGHLHQVAGDRRFLEGR